MLYFLFCFQYYRSVKCNDWFCYLPCFLLGCYPTEKSLIELIFQRVLRNRKYVGCNDNKMRRWILWSLKKPPLETEAWSIVFNVSRFQEEFKTLFTECNWIFSMFSSRKNGFTVTKTFPKNANFLILKIRKIRKFSSSTQPQFVSIGKHKMTAKQEIHAFLSWNINWNFLKGIFD